MSYYKGDFYVGDPGIGSFFAGLAKKAVGFIPGVGPAISAILPGGARAAVKSTIVKASEAMPRMTAAVGAAKTAIVKHPVISAAAAAGAIGAGGYVMGKSRGAAAARAAAAGMGHRKRRRMNPCNVKALRRASRRAHAFLKISSKLVRYYKPHKPKGRPFIRHRKRAA